MNFLKKYIDTKTIKFIIVGIANTILGTTIMFVLYNVFSASYWVSSACNYIFGSIFSYFLNKYFTFQYHKRSWKIVAKFILNIAFCYLIAYGVAKPLVYLMLSGASVTMQENIAMLVGMVIFVTLNYFGQRLFAFKPDEE